MNPEFGTDLRRSLFDNMTNLNSEILRLKIIDSINIFIPEIILGEVKIEPNFDSNILDVTINYRLAISNIPDQVTVQFI
jgi:phage baseplate assembly protein W